MNELVIDWEWNPKTAALFFDKIVPCTITNFPPQEMLAELVPANLLSKNNVVPEYLELLKAFKVMEINLEVQKRTLDDARDCLAKLGIPYTGNPLLALEQLSQIVGATGDKPKLSEGIERSWEENRAKIGNAVDVFFSRYSLWKTPMLIHQRSSDQAPVANVESWLDFVVVLDGLSVINTEKTDWAQIKELRQDKESTMAFRRFRRLFRESYKGKEVSEIKDDLLIRIDDYETAIKKWSLDTTETAIGVVASSGIALGGGLSLLVSALLGIDPGDLPQTITASGAVFAGSTITLQVARSIANKNQIEKSSEVNYLMQAQKLSKDGQTI